MSVQAGHMTADEFERLAERSTNRHLEYVGGEAVEMVSNNYASLVAARILARLLLYAEQNNLGYVTGADGGYVVSGERYIPDVAFIGTAKQPTAPRDAWNPNPPDLVVEVLSPTDDPDVLRIKVGNYLSAGTVIWVVNPAKQRVEVYAPGQPVQKIGIGGMLDGGDILPGFSLAVETIFPEE